MEHSELMKELNRIINYLFDEDQPSEKPKKNTPAKT